MDQPRPILGFGRAGWFLLPFALGLLVLFLAGFNPHTAVLILINENFGTQAMLDVSARVYMPLEDENFMNRVPAPGLGIFQVCVLLIALHIHPRRASRVAVMVCCIWAVVGRSGWYQLSWAIGQHDFVLVGVLYAVICALLLLWATGSKKLLLWCLMLAVLAMVAVSVCWTWTFFGRLFADVDFGYKLPYIRVPTHLLVRWPGCLVWNLAYTGAIMWWGISARRRLFRSQSETKPFCYECGYDLAGLGWVTHCPECGAER